MVTLSAEQADRIRLELGRDLGARIALFHQAIGERLGLGVTDVKCLDRIARRWDEPITAGKLAEETGLSTGAITGVLDRLEKAGFVTREKDPNDRRQVRVRAVPERAAVTDAMFTSIRARWSELCARYDERELALVDDFLRRFSELLAEEAGRMRGAAPTAEDGPYDVEHPLDGADEGRLELKHFGMPLRLGTTGADFLVRVRAEGSPPSVQRSGGKVVVEGGIGARMPFRRRGRVELAIAASIPWSIRARGGLADLEAQLEAVRVRGLEIGGGVSRVVLGLGRPEGTVPVKIHGGAHELSITRPADVPIRVRLGGGAHQVRLDDLALGAVGGELRYESPTFADASDRYDVELTGGAHALVVGGAR